MVMVMAWVGVTWTVWRMGILDCPQEVCRPGSFLSDVLDVIPHCL